MWATPALIATKVPSGGVACPKLGPIGSMSALGCGRKRKHLHPTLDLLNPVKHLFRELRRVLEGPGLSGPTGQAGGPGADPEGLPTWNGEATCAAGTGSGMPWRLCSPTPKLYSHTLNWYENSLHWVLDMTFREGREPHLHRARRSQHGPPAPSGSQPKRVVCRDRSGSMYKGAGVASSWCLPSVDGITNGKVFDAHRAARQPMVVG